MAKKYVYSHMDKLVELLNEYAPDYCKDYPDDVIMDAIVISKRFGFIERLVENDKIDLIEFTRKKSERFSSVYISNEPTKKEYYTECLLMLLSISDTPIEDLISYLK